nr:PDZ domain-containing protein [Calditrichia bacterium]
ENSPAEKAGLKTEDVIVKLDGEAVHNSAELSNRIAGLSPGSTTKVTLYRDGDEKNINVKLGELPEDELAEDMQDSGKRGKLGMGLTDFNGELADRFNLDADLKGALVTQVQPGSPAAEAGLRTGDLILRVNRKSVGSAGEAKELLANSPSDKPILLQVRRGNGSLFIVIEAE